MSSPKNYLDTYRRTLLDMHIPDWHPEFLRDYDPEKLANLYAEAKIEGVLFYCKSHMGHNYWPCPVGSIHPAAKNRDLVGELFNALKSRGIAPAAYHTVVFDNWAVLTHPDWKNKPLFDEDDVDLPFLMGRKYGTACPNNNEYRQYESTQIKALLELTQAVTRLGETLKYRIILPAAEVFMSKVVDVDKNGKLSVGTATNF